MAGAVTVGALVVNMRADVSGLKTDMNAANAVVGSSSQKMGADLSTIRTSMEGIAGSLAAMEEAERARAVAFDEGLTGSARLFAIAGAAAKEAQQNFAALKIDPNAVIVPDKAIQSLKTWQETAAYSLGVGLAAGTEVAKTAFEKVADFVKAKLIITGAVAATGIAAAIFTGIYAAYKAIDFAIGLLTGESYKSLNIDALIVMNNEVKVLQGSLQLTAVEASALNEALKKQGLDAKEYAATINSVTQSSRKNGEELDRLGVKYKDQNGGLVSTENALKSALAVLGTYTAGWDRHQAEVAIGMGTEKQIQDALSVTATKVQEAKDRLIDYGLVIGVGTQEAVAKYEEAMRLFTREADLTSQGFKRAIADNIMPILTDLSVFFQDGFPFAVRAFRYAMATVVSLFYGLKTVVYMVTESIVGSISAIGSALGAVASASMKAMSGDFTGAQAELTKGWTEAKTRLGGIGDNIVEQARHNSDAMALAWGADSLGANNVEKAAVKTGKAWQDAAKKTKEATTSMQSDFEKLMKSESEKLAQAIAESLSTEKLNDAQKVRIKLDADLLSGASKMTEVEQKLVKTQIDIRDTILQATEAAAAAAKVFADYAAEQQKTVDAALQEATANEAASATFGMTKTQIEQLTLARLNDQLAQRSASGLTQDEVNNLEKLISAKRRSVEALKEVDTLTIAKKAADDASAAWQKTADDIDKGLSNALMHGFTGTKGFITDFISGLKGLFSKLVLQPIIAPISGGIASMLNPTAAQAGGLAGGGGGLGGIASGIGSMYEGFASSSLGVSLGLGNAMAASTTAIAALDGSVAAFGAAEALAAPALTSLGATIGMAIPYVGLALGAVALISSLFDNKPEENTKLTFGSSANNITNSTDTGRNQKGGNFVGGAGVNTAFGSFGVTDQFWIDSIAAANRPKLETFLQGVKQSDAALAKYLTIDEQSRVKSALDNSTTVLSTGKEGSDPSTQYGIAFTARIHDIMNGVEAGLSKFTDSFQGTSDQLAAEAAGILDVRKNIGALSKTFGESVSLDSLGAFKREGESLTASIQRLTSEFSLTDSIALMLGKDASTAFGALGLASADTRDRLVTLAGGITKLQASAAGFAQNYLTQAEQLVPVQKQVTDGLAALGLSSITTRDQFKTTVQALDLSTESGQATYVALMNLQAAFAATIPAIDATAVAAAAAAAAQQAKAAADQAAAAAEKHTADIANQQRALDIQLMEALGNSEGALAAKRSDALAALDVSLRGTQQAIYAAQDASAAIAKAQAASQAAQQAAQAADQAAQQAKQAQQQQDQQAMQAYTQRVTTARSALQTAYNSESSALQNLAKTAEASVVTFRKAQDSMFNGATSPLSVAAKFSNAQTDLPSVIARAKTGDTEAITKLQEFVALSQSSRSDFQDYQKDFAVAMAALGDGATASESAAKIAKDQLFELKESVTGLLGVTNATTAGALSVVDAIAALQAATAGGLGSLANSLGVKSSAASAAPNDPGGAGRLVNPGAYGNFNGPPENLPHMTSADTGAIQSASSNYLQSKYGFSAGEIATELPFILGQVVPQFISQVNGSIGNGSLGSASGLSAQLMHSLDSTAVSDSLKIGSGANSAGTTLDLSSILNNYMDGSHANGLDYVPFDGYRAELHKGERVQTAAQASKSDSGNAALIEEIRMLRAEVRAVVGNTKDTYKTLDRWTNVGLPATETA